MSVPHGRSRPRVLTRTAAYSENMNPRLTSLIVAAPLIGFVFLMLGCENGATEHRVGDAYEQNNMPSAAPDRLAGPHRTSPDGMSTDAVLSGGTDSSDPARVR